MTDAALRSPARSPQADARGINALCANFANFGTARTRRMITFYANFANFADSGGPA